MKAAEAAEESVSTLNAQVTSQMDDVNKRFLSQEERITRLEGEIFTRSS